MSRSIHVTKKNFQGLSKKEIEAQAIDSDSDLTQWSKKSHLKKELKKKRKSKRLK